MGKVLEKSRVTFLHSARAVSLQMLPPVQVEDSVMFWDYSLKPALFSKLLRAEETFQAG